MYDLYGGNPLSVETVSLCVVARNEEDFLPNLLNDFLQQSYPKEKTEIVLVDSMSTDDTRKVMENFAQKYQSEYIAVRVEENPKRILAFGWNKAIISATGDVVIRVDAHAHIPVDFVEKNMNLHQSGEKITGGVRPCISANNSQWGDVLLEVENSLFGSSFNVSRRGTQRQYVKTMFHAAYRRELFDEVGLFNEKLARTEDNEMNYRMRMAGYKICFDPEIISYQYARNTLRRMIRQKYSNGYWIALTLGVCPGCISVYHLVPAAFVLAIFSTTLLSLFGFHLLTALMWGAYGIFAILGTVLSIAKGKGNAFSILMPFLFLLLHVSYGVGTLVGLLKMPSFAKKVRQEQ